MTVTGGGWYNEAPSRDATPGAPESIQWTGTGKVPRHPPGQEHPLKRIFPTLLAAATVGMCLALAAPAGAATAAAPELRWRPYNEALQLAQKENKAVLVDVYTSWCGWCKRMEATTYKDASVIEELNKYFTLVKLDAEASTPLVYRKMPLTASRLSREVFGVSGYPTTVFVRSDEEIIAPLSGYVKADEFKLILRYIGSKAYENTTFEDFRRLDNLIPRSAR